jgi:hypothetical protein
MFDRAQFVVVFVPQAASLCCSRKVQAGSLYYKNCLEPG